MSTIPNGYRLAVLDPNGNVLDVIELGDSNPTKTAIAAMSLAEEITAALPAEARP